jgi:Uma2 family endonuclease
MDSVLTAATYHAELIGGVEVEKPLPKEFHAFIQMYLNMALSRQMPPRYYPMPELNVQTGGVMPDGRREYVIPDIVVTERTRTSFADGNLVEAPALAVEILSVGQTIVDLMVRAERLLKLGCPTVWVVWPEKHRAWEYSKDDLRECSGTLTAPLPAGHTASINLAEMWAEMEQE